MAKSNGGSVAPKERINIVYRPATGGRKEQIELPLKIMVTGDFTQREDERPIEERTPSAINKNNFNDVLEGMHVSTAFSVPDRLAEQEGQEISVKLNFNNMSDFGPGSVLAAIPELKQVLELREALKALKGPLGNVPAMRRKIQEIVLDDKKSAKLMKELGLS